MYQSTKYEGQTDVKKRFASLNFWGEQPLALKLIEKD